MKTSSQRERARRDKRLVSERNRRLSKPGAMATAVDQLLASKYGISRSTIWHIVNRCQSTTTAHAINPDK